MTAHDGFTLNDLVSYNDKHNHANGEHNNDGESHNSSWNCGAEGPTDDVLINELRERQKRNFLTTMFLSQGVPMLVAGDEIGRTQLGNNNAYCQDNELSWLDWKNMDEGLLQFTRRIIHFRKKHPVFRRRNWFKGLPIKGVGVEDIAWFLPSGSEMTEQNWNEDFAKSLGVYLNGKGIHSVGPKGEVVIDDSFYIIFNAFHGRLKYILPPEKYGHEWSIELDTSERPLEKEGARFMAADQILIEGRSVLLLKQVTHDSDRHHEENHWR